jgi:hypothetical protein
VQFAGTTTKPEGEETGLGLDLAWRIVQKHPLPSWPRHGWGLTTKVIQPTSVGISAPAAYSGRMTGKRVPGGVVHQLPADLREALIANATALAAWKDITPLARNEFICWVEDAKQQATRTRRIRRTQEELEEGQRRPCCWPGCKHRERTGS